MTMSRRFAPATQLPDSSDRRGDALALMPETPGPPDLVPWR
jgi:hypothetical protein